MSGHFRALLLQAQLDDEREVQQSAIGWVVVAVDTQGAEWQLPFAMGLFDTDADACFYAASLDAADERWGTEGWRHVVIPVRPPG